MSRQGPTYLFELGLVLAVGLGACDADAGHAPVAPVDVSFLLPLTVGPTRTTAETAGAYGVLIPRTHFDAIAASEPLTRVDEPDELYANLAVVAVRLDPCFFEGVGPVTCASQVRLVLQPVLDLGAAAPVVRDTAIHAFYDVPRAEIDALASALASLRVRQGAAETIGVHFASEAAMKLVLARVGAERLSRMTHMSVHSSNEAWVFGGFDIVNGQRVAIAIPGIESSDAPDGDARFRFEQHISSTGTLGDLAATILPEPIIEPDIGAFIDARRRVDLSEVDRDLSIAGLGRLLDPAHHNPGTVDCASCHVATTAMRFATRDADPGFIDAAYDDTRNQRMFGWFGDVPSVSQRVILETEAVVDRLNALD